MTSAPEIPSPPETRKRPSRFDALAFVVEVSRIFLEEEEETSSKLPNLTQIHPSPPPPPSKKSPKIPSKSLPPPPKKRRRNSPPRAINPRVPEPETQVIPDLNLSVPQEFMDVMNDMGITDGPVFIIEKNLFKTDVDPGQNRISMPVQSVNKQFTDFLTEEEKKIIHRERDNEILVQMIEPDYTRVSDDVVFKRWKMKKDSGSVSYMYIFNGAVWKNVREVNQLNAGQRFQFWAFRNQDHRLCFAVIRK